MEIKIKLTGYSSVSCNENPVKFPTKKTEAIFYFIALKKSCSREELETIFWPELDQASANNNLRNSIYYLKKIFGVDFFSKNKGVVEINASVYISIDDNPVHGDVLQGFSIKDCPEFELFLEDYKGSHNLAAYDRLKKDFSASIDNFHSQKTIEYFFALKRMNPYDEDIYQMMIGFYQRRNEFEKCIQLYKEIEKTLFTDLSVEPNSELKNIYRLLLLKKNTRTNKIHKYFYGREQELDKVLKSYEDFNNGLQHSNYIVSAPIGCGKTAFINQYLGTVKAKKSILVNIKCFQAEKPFRFHVLEIIMSKFLKTAKIDINNLPDSCRYTFDSIFPLLSNNPTLDQNSAAEKRIQSLTQYRIEEAISEILTYLLSKFKLFLVIDDLNFCDLSSLSYISKVLCPNYKEQVFYLFTIRQEDNKDVIPYFKDSILENNLEILTLNNFSKEDISNILISLVNVKDDLLVDSLVESTNGNPLFLLEVIRSLRNKETPKSYKFITLLEEKVENLAPIEKTVLYFSSLFFDFINYEILSGIINMSTIKTLETFESLVDQGLIKEEISEKKIRLIFSHEKFREYIYNKQPLVKRMTLHGKIADYIVDHMLGETFDINLIDSLSYHYQKAGNVAKYIDFKLKKLGRISDIDNPLPDYFAPITYDYIEDLEREINENAVPMNLKFEFVLLKGCFYIRTCHYEEGLRCLNYILDYDHEIDHLKLAYRQMFFYSVQVLDRKLMKEYSLKGLLLLKKWPDELKKAEFLKFFALSEIHHAHFDNAKKALKISLDIFEKAEPDGYSMNNIACIHNYLGYEGKYKGNYAETIPHYNKAIEICKNSNIINGLPLYYMNMGHSLFKLGNIQEAEKYFIKSDNLHYKMDMILSKSLTKAYLALINFQRGDYSQAEAYLRQAVDLAKLLNNLYENAYLFKIICLLKRQTSQEKDFRTKLDCIAPEDYSYYFSLAQDAFSRLNLQREMVEIS